MKLAIIQPKSSHDSPEDKIASLRAQVAASKGHHPDVVVFPELILPGYNFPDRHGRDAQSLNGSWMTRMRGAAREYQCAIVFGWAETHEGAVYNAATAISAAGEILTHYRKRQLFGEMEHSSFASGTSRPHVFEIAGRKCGLLICYEIEFPEYARDLARQGAEVVIVPTANPVGYEHVQDILVPARACENRQFVVYANYCGTQNGLDFSGASLVAGPDGKVLARAGQQPTELYVPLPELSAYPASALSTQLQDLRTLAGQPDGRHRG